MLFVERRKSCGKCSGCSASNCGKCRFCTDMSCYGGSGRLKQRCINRKCHMMKTKEQSDLSQ